MTSSFGTTVGFDSIAVALLARSNPLVIVPAASCSAGCARARADADPGADPAELVDVLQATILLFLVASPVLRRLLRVGGRDAGSVVTGATVSSLGSGGVTI